MSTLFDMNFCLRLRFAKSHRSRFSFLFSSVFTTVHLILRCTCDTKQTIDVTEVHS